jgi:hypothetical protein
VASSQPINRAIVVAVVLLVTTFVLCCLFVLGGAQQAKRASSLAFLTLAYQGNGRWSICHIDKPSNRRTWEGDATAYVTVTHTTIGSPLVWSEEWDASVVVKPVVPDFALGSNNTVADYDARVPDDAAVLTAIAGSGTPVYIGWPRELTTKGLHVRHVWNQLVDGGWVAAPWVGPGVVVAIPFAYVGLRRRRAKRRPGCCHSCGYSLAGLPSGVCPECGKGAR